MKVKAKAFASIAEIIGKREIEVELEEGATIRRLLQVIFQEFGAELKNEIWDSKKDAPQAYIKIMLNGRDIDFIGGVKTELSEGDIVAIFPPIAGG